MIRGVSKSFKTFQALRLSSVRCFSVDTHTDISKMDLFNPTPEHRHLRETLRSFVESEVDPQALEYNRKELFNIPLFKKLGDLGLLGITVDPEYGGSGMDAVAAVIAHGKYSAFIHYYSFIYYPFLLTIMKFRGIGSFRSCLLFVLPGSFDVIRQQSCSKW